MEITTLNLTVGQYSVSNLDPQRRYGAMAIVDGVNTGLAEQRACLFTYGGGMWKKGTYNVRRYGTAYTVHCMHIPNVSLQF